MSRQNRATHPQIKVSHLSLDPCVALSFHSQQAGGQGGVSRRAGGGYRGRGAFGFRKRIALQRGVAATVTPVALLCATKDLCVCNIKNLLMPLFLMGCFPVDFQEVKRPLRTKLAKRPIKVGKRPINKRKRPIKAMVLVGISVGHLMGCFRTPPPWQKTAPLKRPIKRSMTILLIATVWST